MFAGIWSLAVLAAALPLEARFSITARTAICVSAAEPGFVRLAAQDLAADIGRVTGRAPAVREGLRSCAAGSIVIASLTRMPEAIPAATAAALRGKWEASRVVETPAGLLIGGSDERGAMFGVYDFTEHYVGIDPLYYWSGREPRRRDLLAWDKVAIDAPEPTFHYRGWFINDEDLLTEWRDGGGARDIDYPYYHQVTAPEVLARVFEAAVRLRMNLIIPASFTDIDNPAERRMIESATARGLHVSMHHVEPMGVSAFAFARYWKSQGLQAPFSFFTERARFEKTWRHYAEQWARFPGVVWQLGLRGVADRPVWVSDPNAPKTDEERGKLISDAIATQWEIVRSVDLRPHPLATTTLWMEGSDLNRKRRLRFPRDLAVIFSDNSPGWKMQADFFETEREAGRPYGIYYHHALWGSGPHLAQAVPPRKTYEVFREAVTRGSHWYAILNVSNVREFVLGLDASARMLRRFEGFVPDRYLDEWCRERFGGASGLAARAYRSFFSAYLVDEKRGTPDLLDGLMLHNGTRALEDLIADKPAAATAARLERIRRQRISLEGAAAEAGQARAAMDESGRTFFETNLIAQLRILLGLNRWLEAVTSASLARAAGDRAPVAAALGEAAAAFQVIRAGQALASRGEFRDWYRGDRKMDLARAERLTAEAARRIAGRQP